jgi:hypothetical protein
LFYEAAMESRIGGQRARNAANGGGEGRGALQYQA